MDNLNKVVLVGNGFDLAHKLKTSYKNFLDWYVCKSFNGFCIERSYSDPLFELKNKHSGYFNTFNKPPETFEDVLNLIATDDLQRISYGSDFFKQLLLSFKSNNWVDIERYYFNQLKEYFTNPNIAPQRKKEIVIKLNNDFDYLISQLSSYIKTINASLENVCSLQLDDDKTNIGAILKSSQRLGKALFLNFNYTETLQLKGYAKEEEVIHIHGRVADADRNPIIFGYGDETDPIYQKIEDSGENVYLEHIKSFGYFRTPNYHNLLSFIDSAPYPHISWVTLVDYLIASY
jgi:hypothetical protein